MASDRSKRGSSVSHRTSSGDSPFGGDVCGYGRPSGAFGRRGGNSWWERVSAATSIANFWNIPWHFLFLSLALHLWKRRCNHTFTLECLSIGAVFSQSLGWAKHYNNCKLHPTANSTNTAVSVCWSKLPPGWFCLNTDGAASTDTSRSAAAGVFRHCEGNWILGFTDSTGYCSSHQAELWGIFTGLKITWENGYERVIVQTDCFGNYDLQL
ncbi:hypothetical protein F3Y22_tig00002169pilonHSYRG00031 [Hibiscus syriacus]|uniref:RNase H type-1 domain-containing protein n=1 Tax=Hibiscus syriacus TaxID=106335 RepID=A0A6A3CYS9_HIBSY|nr:hypothetical protein F3Y22_tig00002169pilonHSYRG00031 [Hibiscus syriacus]